MSLPIEHLLAIGGEFETIDALEHLIELALLKIEFVQRCAGCSRFSSHGGFDQKERARFAGDKGVITAGRYRQREDALADVVEIDRDLGGLFLFPGLTRRGGVGFLLAGLV